MKRYTFSKIMVEFQVSAGALLDAIRSTGLKGRLAHGERSWSAAEVAELVKACK